MDLSLLPTLVELVKANIFVTVLVGLVYGVLFLLIFRELRKSHASLEHIATMVRDLHPR